MKFFVAPILAGLLFGTPTWANEEQLNCLAESDSDTMEERPFVFSYDVPGTEEFDLHEVELRVLAIKPNPNFPGLLVIASIISEDEIEKIVDFEPDHMHIKWNLQGDEMWFSLDEFEYYARRELCHL